MGVSRFTFYCLEYFHFIFRRTNNTTFISAGITLLGKSQVTPRLGF